MYRIGKGKNLNLNKRNDSKINLKIKLTGDMMYMHSKRILHFHCQLYLAPNFVDLVGIGEPQI